MNQIYIQSRRAGPGPWFALTVIHQHRSLKRAVHAFSLPILLAFHLPFKLEQVAEIERTSALELDRIPAPSHTLAARPWARYFLSLSFPSY